MMMSLLCIFVSFVTIQVNTGSRVGPTTPRPSDFTQCRLNDKLKEQFVDFHNEFRGQVQPSAADMEYLVSYTPLFHLSVNGSVLCFTSF